MILLELEYEPGVSVTIRTIPGPEDGDYKTELSYLKGMSVYNSLEETIVALQLQVKNRRDEQELATLREFKQKAVVAGLDSTVDAVDLRPVITPVEEISVG